MGLIPGSWLLKLPSHPEWHSGRRSTDTRRHHCISWARARSKALRRSIQNSAGVVIQLADMAQFYEVQDVETHIDNAKGANRIFEQFGDQPLSFERAVATAHWGTAQIFEAHLMYPNYCLNPSPWHGKLGWLLQFIQETAVIHGIDLHAATAARMEYLRR